MGELRKYTKYYISILTSQKFVLNIFIYLERN